MDESRLQEIANELAVGGNRIDWDAPGPDDAYVIRIETGDRHRLKAVISRAELAGLSPDARLRLITSKAAGLGSLLVIQQTKPAEAHR